MSLPFRVKVNPLEAIQLLNAEQILGQLDGGSVTVLPLLTPRISTFLIVSESLNRAMPVLPEYQQAGRGRRGRKWFRLLAQTYIVDVLASGTRPGGGGLV